MFAACYAVNTSCFQEILAGVSREAAEAAARFLDGSRPVCSNDFVTTGAILALDYGSRNIGLACSDELGVTVRPLQSIPNRSRRDVIDLLKSAVETHRIRRLVIGMPWNMNGSSGEATARIERVMDGLRAEFDIPLSAVDERLSTIEAREVWNRMSARQKRRYRTVDSLAAALILERYLREEPQ